MSGDIITLQSPKQQSDRLILTANRRVGVSYGPLDFSSSTTSTDNVLFAFTLPTVVTDFPRSYFALGYFAYSEYSTGSSDNELEIWIYDEYESKDVTEKVVISDSGPWLGVFSFKEDYQGLSKPVRLGPNLMTLRADVTIDSGSVEVDGLTILLELEPVIGT